MARARRQGRGHLGRRRVGHRLRHHRRPALPRHHRPRAVLRRPGKHPIDALKIWDGGLGIWGAIALGALGAWIGCRRKGISADRVRRRGGARAWSSRRASAAGATGSTTSSTAGRPACRGSCRSTIWTSTTGHAQPCTFGHLGATVLRRTTSRRSCTSRCGTSRSALLLILLDRRWRLGRGNVLALYVMGYTAGRFWIEALRSDHAQPLPRPAAQRLDIASSCSSPAWRGSAPPQYVRRVAPTLTRWPDAEAADRRRDRAEAEADGRVEPGDRAGRRGEPSRRRAIERRPGDDEHRRAAMTPTRRR